MLFEIGHRLQFFIGVAGMTTTKRAGFGTVFFVIVGLSSVAVAAPEGKSSPSGVVADQSQDAQMAALSIREKYQRPDKAPFPDDNPYSEAKVRLGKTLFFDPRLSKSDSISCASCHNPSFAWGDGRTRAVGHGMKQLPRRSPTIINAAWTAVFMWDGRFPSLEEQALGPITSAAEMNMPLDELIPKLEKIEEYRPLFASAFDGSPEVTADKIAKAIATFERTLVSTDAPFDRWVRGDERAISQSAKRGFELFNGKANCHACHEGWRFTDDSFHDIGLPDGDMGRGKMLPSIEKMQHAFKTPSLRNIDRRGPYMHNGSLADLATVIDYYDRAAIERPSRSDEIRALRLSEQEKQDLVAFLETLTSDDPPPALPLLPR